MTSPNRKLSQTIHAPKKLFLSYARNDLDCRPRSDNEEDIDGGRNPCHDKASENGSKSMLNSLLDVPLNVSESDNSHAIAPWDCIEDVNFSSEMGTGQFLSSNKHGVGNIPPYSSSYNVLKNELRTVLSPYDGVGNATRSADSNSSISPFSSLRYTSGIQSCETKVTNSALSEEEMKKLTSESLLGLEDINYITTSPHIPDHIKRIVLLASVSPNLENTLDKNEMITAKSIDVQHMEWKRSTISDMHNTPCPATCLPSTTVVADFGKNMECSSLNALANTATELESREFRLQLPQTQHVLHRNRPRLWKGRSDASKDVFGASSELSMSLNNDVSEFSPTTEILNLDTNIAISGSLSTIDDYSEKHLRTRNQPETDPTYTFCSNNPPEYVCGQTADFQCSSSNPGIYDRTQTLPLSVYHTDCASLSEMTTGKRHDLQVRETSSLFRPEYTSLLDAEIIPYSNKHLIPTDSSFVEDMSGKESAVPISCSIPDTRSLKTNEPRHLMCKDEEPTTMAFEDLPEIKVKEEMEIESTVSSSVPSTPRRSSKCKSREKKNVSHLNNNLECQVCGDTAAGFYCGAYICEACKVIICF